jgi:hypothetical protein
MERDALTNDVDHAYKVSNDLRRFLTHLYGPPDVTLVPADTRNGAEILVALLYGEAHPTRYSLLLPASRNDTGSRAVGQRIATDAISKDNPLLD